MAAKKKAKKNTSPKAKQKPAAKKAAPPVKKGPRQTSLPGMEDRAVQELDDAALSYDEVKKARMKLTVKEKDAKDLISSMMHKAGKKHYAHGNIVVDIVPEGEKVKVKVTAEGSDEPGDPGQTVEEEEVVVEEEVEEEEIEEEAEESAEEEDEDVDRFEP